LQNDFVGASPDADEHIAMIEARMQIQDLIILARQQQESEDQNAEIRAAIL
jgi:hypothetical protein